jgi:alpha-glucosidase
MVNNKFIFLFVVLFSFILFAYPQEGKSTASANVSVLKKEFIIPKLNRISHKVWLYLPPNYHSTTKKFPVIFMHDAQNVFDAATSYAGEWKVDEQLNDIYSKNSKGFIVVAIENGGEKRIEEYTPWKHKKYGGGMGEIYIDWIVSTLKPYIDNNYRTKSQAKYTALIGSSLGGLISYYGGLKYPKVFGKIGALSTSFWFSDEVIKFTEESKLNKKQKLFLLVGGEEGEGMEKDTKEMYDLLLKEGYKSSNLKLKINPKGKHNEAFWSSEFTDIINWLYNLN